MLLPLARQLRRSPMRVITWDYPRVFSNIDESVATLSSLMQRENRMGRSIGLITHSFGDWIARQAVASLEEVSIARWISICPVIREVPVAQWIHRWCGDRLAEIAIMADPEEASANLVDGSAVKHTTIWAQWEWLVRPREGMPRHELLGTHNSVLFQPNLWRLVAAELE